MRVLSGGVAIIVIYGTCPHKHENCERGRNPETWFVKQCETKASEMSFLKRALT